MLAPVLAFTAAVLAQVPHEVPVPPDAPAPPGASPDPLPKAQTPLAAVMSKLVVLADATGTQILVDGEDRGVAPLSLPLEAGPHAVSFVAPGLPPFHVDVEVPADGRTEVSVKVAQRRPAEDFAQKKSAFDDAMLGVAMKGVGGLCGCGLGAAAFGLAGATALVPATAATLIPIGSAIAGMVGCLGGGGLCGLSVLDILDSPDEPIIPRVHVIKITPPSGPVDARVVEIEAPPVDSDGDPIGDDDDDEESPPSGVEGESDIVEARFTHGVSY